MRRSLTALMAVSSALVAAVVISGFVVVTLSTRALQDTASEQLRSSVALTTASQLEGFVLDLETGLRGYLLAGAPRFLAPYEDALNRYPATAARLRQVTAADPAARAISRQLSAEIDSYADSWAAPVIATARHDLVRARREEASGRGKQRIDAIRAQFTRLLADEAALHSGDAARAASLAQRVFVSGLVAISIFLIVIVYLTLAGERRLVGPLRRLAGAVRQVTAGDLSVRVPAGGTAEVGTLVAGFNRMASSLQEQRSELEDANHEVEAQNAELAAALATLEERSAHIELVRRFGDRLAGETSVAEVAAAALEGIADAGACEIGAVYLLDPRRDVHAAVATRGLGAPRGLAPVIPARGLAGRAVAEGRPVHVLSAETTLHAAGLQGERAAGHEVHLPLVQDGEVIGVISLGRLTAEPFSDAELGLLDDLAERAAVGCARALITERLRQTAHELGALLEATDEGIYVIDAGGDVTLVNRAALEMTGFSRDELLGHNSHRMLHHTREDGSRYPQRECPIYESTQTGEGTRASDEVYWRRDGTSFPVEYSAYPLFEDERITGAVVTFLDITHRRQLQRQRDTQHAVTRVFAEAASAGEAGPLMLDAVCEGLGFEVGITWLVEAPDGPLRLRSTHVAAGFEAQLGPLAPDTLARAGSLAGRTIGRGDPVLCTDLDRDPPRVDWPSDSPMRTAAAMPILTRDGVPLAVAEVFSTVAMPEEGLIDNLRAIGRQIDQYLERQRAEEDAQRMKDQIVANVSHELRTPLTAIDGWVHILLGGEPGPLTDDQRRFLQTVKRNSDRLMRLVGDLLIAGQIEAGQLNLELADVDVAEVARDTVEVVGQSAQSKRIALTLQAPAPVLVRGDRQRLGQLLSNLMANAIKFTPEDGSVDVSVQADGLTCRITVSDTGIGIPPAERARLFERFFRASTATERGITGTGLGLAISRAIAESHDGTLELIDTSGPGTTFVVRLPLQTRQEAYA